MRAEDKSKKKKKGKAPIGKKGPAMPPMMGGGGGFPMFKKGGKTKSY